MQKNRTSPLAYSAPQVLEQAIGFSNTGEGYVVLTKTFAQDLITELDRLYSVEAAAIEIVNELFQGQPFMVDKNKAIETIISIGDQSLLNLESDNQ